MGVTSSDTPTLRPVSRAFQRTVPVPGGTQKTSTSGVQARVPVMGTPERMGLAEAN